jgi:hypothetical protein
MQALLHVATADDTATMGTRRRTYAPPQLRQRKPPRRFLPKRWVVKLSFRNVAAAHSPKDLGAVRVFLNSSFIEALNRDIEVEPRNLQIPALLSHVTPMMARADRSAFSVTFRIATFIARITMSASICSSRQAWRSAGTHEWRPPGGSAGRHLLSFGGGDKSFALGLLAREFAGSPDRFAPFPCRLFRRLLVKSPTFHFAKHTFALHPLLEHTERLIDIVVADEDLQEAFPSLIESR